jgi:hypothetical protein
MSALREPAALVTHMSAVPHTSGLVAAHAEHAEHAEQQAAGHVEQQAAEQLAA